MNTKTLFIAMLISGTLFAQDDSSINSSNSIPQTITIQHQTSLESVPDEIEMTITLLEYVKTDPETQQTSTIEMAEIEQQLLEKIKPFGITNSDLSLVEISDQVQNANANMYAYGNIQPYTNTQKRLIRKTYSITWTRSTNELQPFMESLRLSGIQSINLQTRISAKKTLEMKEQLLKKVIAESKEQAEFVASVAKNSLGDIVSCTINPSEMGVISDSVIYPNYINYNNYYGSSNGQLNKSKMSMSISIVYEMK